MTAPEVAAQNLRTLLAEIDAGELDCSPTYRRLLEGSAVALQVSAEHQALNWSGSTPSAR